MDKAKSTTYNDISLIVITSLAPSNPSTELISQAIDSCKLLDGLDECPVIVVMDGFKVGPVNRTKLGRITEESEVRYDQYHQALLKLYTSPRFKVVRCDTHHGFALAVKVGLELCTTTYAIIAQHDRMFCAPFNRIGELLQNMKENDLIRYIGFPTSTNLSHDKFISTNYNLYCLNKPEVKRYLGGDLYLQPVVFWYDSQHIAHVQRYLQIYRPFRNIPVHLREIIGLSAVKGMLLRPGDFIEDRFGQMQRRLLWKLATKELKSIAAPDDSTETESASSNVDCETTEEGECKPAKTVFTGGCIDEVITSATAPTPTPAACHGVSMNAELVVELFRWYGSYLCWQNTSSTPYEVHTAQSRNDTVVMVRHLRGRQLNDEGIAWKLASFSAATATTTANTAGSAGDTGSSPPPSPITAPSLPTAEDTESERAECEGEC